MRKDEFSLVDKMTDDAYKQGRADGITRVLDILDHLDTQMLEIVKDALYEQDYQNSKEQNNEKE